MANNFANPWKLDTATGGVTKPNRTVINSMQLVTDFVANPTHKAVVTDANGAKWTLDANNRFLAFGEPVMIRNFRLSTIDSGYLLVETC